MNDRQIGHRLSSIVHRPMGAQIASPSRTGAAHTRIHDARRVGVSALLAALVWWLAPALGLAYVLASSYGALGERAYASANGFTGEILAEHSVGQTFVARYDGLTAVELRVAISGPQAPAWAVLHLRAAPQGPDIATISVSAADIKSDYPWQVFSFPTLHDSRDRTFYLELESPNGAPGKALNLFWWQPQKDGDAYADGTAYIDGRPQRADLAFGLRYASSPADAWAQVARAFSQDAPKSLVALLVLVISLGLGRLAWGIWKERQLARTNHGFARTWALPALLTVALAHGLLYALLVPPWQGPDEPSHFAYAALLYRHDLDARAVQSLDWQHKDRDQALEAAIGSSLNRHNFTRYLASFPEPGAPLDPGLATYSELRQPPAYYLLCAAAMRVASVDPYTAPEAALRLMRLVSVLGSLGVVVLAWLAGRLLSGPSGVRAWLPLMLPLTIILLPMRAFADSIANNDALAELSVSALAVAVVAMLCRPRGLRGSLLAALVVALGGLSLAAKPSALAAALPLGALALLAWVISMLTRRGEDGKRADASNRQVRLLTVSLGGGALFLVSLFAFIAAPLLFKPLGTAAGWRLNNHYIDKAPAMRSDSAHDGQYVLSLPKGSSASQQIAIAPSHPQLHLSVSGYARLRDRSPAGQPASATLRLEVAGLPAAQVETPLGAGNAWTPISASLDIPPGVNAVTVKLSPKGPGLEFDDFSLSGDGAPLSIQPAILNASFEQQEVGLRGPLAKLPQEAGWVAQVAANPQSFDKAQLWAYYADTQFRSFWGNFGWVSVSLPGGWLTFWLVLSAMALLGLLWKIVGEARPWDWRDWLRVVFLASFVAAVCIGFARQMMALALFGVGAFPQGRYLFVLSIAVAWLYLSGLSVWANLLGNAANRVVNLVAGARKSTGATRWGVWAWANLMLWFAAYALGALVVPYYYG